MAGLTTTSQNDLIQVSFLRGLDEGLQGVLSCLGRRLTIPRRGWITCSPGLGMLNVLLLRGRAKLALALPDGDRVLLGFAVAGDTFPPVYTSEDLRNCFTAQAVEECQAVAWTQHSLVSIFAKHPDALAALLQNQAPLYLDMMHRLLDRSVKRAPTRIARTVLHLAERYGDQVQNGLIVPFPLSLRDIAEFAGTTRFTVCRVLAGWRRAGIVAYQENRLTVMDARRLNRHAGIEA